MLSSHINNTPPPGHTFQDPGKYEHLTDEEIVEYIVEGQTHLFEVIMRRYNQRLYRVQRAYISNDHGVKDALQSTYIKVFEHLKDFRGEARFATWITRIAINEALKHLEKERRFVRLHAFGETIDEEDNPMIDELTPDRDLIQEELKRLLEASVSRLAPKYRSVYMMRELEGMSTQDTADSLGISSANVKIRLFRARHLIRKDLERSAEGADLFSFRGPRCDLLVYQVMSSIGS